MSQFIRAYDGKTEKNGSRFMTAGMMAAWHRQQKHVREECLTDPLPVDELFFRDIQGNLRSCRGTSQIEGYHARKNAAVNGMRALPDLILAELTYYNFRYNARAAIRASLQARSFWSSLSP